MIPVDMARLRWRNTTPEERKAHARMMGLASAKKRGKRMRRDIARAGGIARAIKAGQRLGQK